MEKLSLSRRSRVRLFTHLDPFQRDVVASILNGEEGKDDAIAERHGATLRAVRVARILTRKRLPALVRGSKASGR